MNQSDSNLLCDLVEPDRVRGKNSEVLEDRWKSGNVIIHLILML